MTDYADVFGWHGDGFLTANDANCRESNRHGYINGRKERRERKGKASIFMKFHVFHGSGLFNAEAQSFFGGGCGFSHPQITQITQIF